ncbi:tetratricopeptide repeat protein [Actinomadura craniellae]|uniref:Tetratricopeptide repeat protein n=1 Tax=Actinomadura craniellae TaxID=2231787 RepID=A0A365GYU7_9ACTN|nr:tetratricopeptide repeat protein [Actinomadura craniellae]RAY11103.1 tetratricopeptide repeat protein [Actinomadura craniellae]
MSTTPDEATADPSLLCEEARRFAENGELDQAARLFERVMELGDTSQRARAALGLAVVRDDAGDTAAARAADQAAIDTGDPEYGPRAAYHLALIQERAGEFEAAARSWRLVVDFGNPAYLPPALLALARLADDAGDAEAAADWWERAVATGDGRYAPVAAHDLAQRLLERGEPARAQRVLAGALRTVDREAEPYAYNRLAVAIGLAYLDQAIGAFGAVLADGGAGADPEVGPLAVELLARTLPLRGRGTEAREVWERGLADPVVSGQVRDRLRRGFGADEADDLWWEPAVESAVGAGTLPGLTGEVFGVLDHMYALLALRYVEGTDAETAEVLGRAIRVPGEYPWGRDLHESFAARLRQAMGPQAPDLPADWPGS